MRKMRVIISFMALLTASAGVGQQESIFFRIRSPTKTTITAFGANGTLVWTSVATEGITCTVQRAVSLVGPDNWVDYVQHAATNTVMALRLFDPVPPTGMTLVPAGSFQMGDTLDDGGEGELPVHTVFLKAFYLDKTEVTWAKWLEVREWAVTNSYDLETVGEGKTESHPVQSVNWYDCVKWCNARSEKEGRTPCYTRGGSTYKTGEYDDIICNWSAQGYRLPTEAEWEKAARGGREGNRFPWGDTISHSNANYYAMSSMQWYDTNGTDGYHPSYSYESLPYTSPAGSFAPNGYGLYDMAGNVFEWCSDWYGDTYYGTSPSSDPTGPGEGSYRLIRGCSWNYDANGCRAAARGYDDPHLRDFNYGVRAVLQLGQH